MNMPLAMILTGCLIVLGSAGMAGFIIWLRYRDAVQASVVKDDA